jgi:hypothetical protein
MILLFVSWAVLGFVTAGLFFNVWASVCNFRTHTDLFKVLNVLPHRPVTAGPILRAMAPVSYMAHMRALMLLRDPWKLYDPIVKDAIDNPHTEVINVCVSEDGADDDGEKPSGLILHGMTRTACFGLSSHSTKYAGPMSGWPIEPNTVPNVPVGVLSPGSLNDLTTRVPFGKQPGYCWRERAPMYPGCVSIPNGLSAGNPAMVGFVTASSPFVVWAEADRYCRGSC